MRYSVIIPVYNAESTLRRCLDSLLRQEYDNAQIILINDGSRDRSGEICREYAKKHDCIVYIEQENAGASSARNAGLAAATGTYITFVDSDDYVLDGYFEKMDRSGDDFLVFSHRAIRSGGISGFLFSRALLDADSHTARILAVLRDRIVSPWNKRFRRSVIEAYNIRFKKDLIIGEDFIFGLEYMLVARSSGVMREELYCVDETGMGSITRAGKYDLRQFLRMYRYAFGIIKECGWSSREKEDLRCLMDMQYCRTAFAAIEHRMKAKGRNQVSAKELIALFRRDLQRDIRPVSPAHTVMRFCVQHRLVPVFVAVAWLHLVLNRK